MTFAPCRRFWHSAARTRQPVAAMNRHVTTGLLFSTLWVCSAASFAAPLSPTAEAAIRDGKNSYNSGDYEAAIESFKRAYSAQADNEVLYQLGKAYAMADWPVEAVDAFERYLSATHVSEARRLEVASAIEGQRRRIGSLIVHVTPDDAVVKVDDGLLGRSAYGTSLPVRQGPHVVSASLDGYLPQVQSVRVRASEPGVVNLVLSPVVPVTYDGWLAVRCRLPAVTVLVDGRRVATTPVAEPILIPEGAHRLSLERVGYRSQTTTIQISRARAAALDCKLPMVRPLESSGQLSLEFPETDAVVFIDGARSARSELLPPGPHSVQVRHYGFEPWVRQLRVDAGIVHRVDVALTPTRAYLRDIEERARSRRTWSYVLGATGTAIVGTALGIGLWNQGRYSDWNQERRDLERAYQAPVADAEAAAELERRRNDVNSQLRSIHSIDIATAALGVAGGMLLGSGTLLLLTAEQPPSQHGQSTALRRAPQGIGMNVDW
jgi:hypothetical protein